jgi:hypothetical protein
MSRKPQTISPVDRAVLELEQRIAVIERESRQLTTVATGQAPAPTPRPGAPLVKWFKDVFTPPGQRPPAGPLRRDLFDPVVNNPMPHLEPQAAAFVRTDAGLFPRAERGRLAQYLSVGSVKTFKPLKHVQRRQRQQFYVWLGLGILAVLVLWVVMH